MTEKKHYLWSEEYRPRTVRDCILPDRLKVPFQKMVDKKQIENMTLVGGPGTGKTTVARAMCEELGIDYLLINASETGNIETIRTTVRTFASTVSFNPGIKCVILDEADYLTMQAQGALRGAIEEFMGNCRFIFTGNYANRIMSAITSRAPVVEFSLTKDEKKQMMIQFLGRIEEVLKEKGVGYNLEELVAVVKKNFPDYRRTWNLIQRFSADGTLRITSQTGIDESTLRELAKMLRDKEFSQMRKWVVENLDNDGAALRRAIYDKVSLEVNPRYIPQLVLILAEYDYKEAHVVDKEINMVAMLATIMAEVEFQ